MYTLLFPFQLFEKERTQASFNHVPQEFVIPDNVEKGIIDFLHIAVVFDCF